MITLAVLGWQLTIILTLGLARLFGDIFNKPGALHWACGAWIIFTLFGVFFMPLIILQLGVIIWTTSKLAPSDNTEKRDRRVKQEKVEKPRKIVPEQPYAKQTPTAHGVGQCEIKDSTPNSLEDFRKCCDSPAEEAFLDIMVQHYALKPVDDCLIGQGITLELQYPIDKCRADFLINDCLIIEIDGAAYHTSKQAIRRDTIRDKFIRSRGFHILRIPAKYPLYRASATINKVRRAISIAAKAEVKNKYAEEDRFFHLGAEDCGLKFKSTPSGLFKATQETLLRNGG